MAKISASETYIAMIRSTGTGLVCFRFEAVTPGFGWLLGDTKDGRWWPMTALRDAGAAIDYLEEEFGFDPSYDLEVDSLAFGDALRAAQAQ